MDNLTHSLVGLMMSRSGIDRKIENSAAVMVLAANIPDVDIVSGLFGSLNYLEWHRNLTHALAPAPLMALVPLLIVWGFSKKRPGAWAYFFSLLGVLSHLVLDWTNVYGLRMLLPFSSRWLRLDQTDVVDPWIWTVLLLAVAAPAFVKLVGSEIGSKAGTGPTRGWAWFALIIIGAYEGVRFTAHERAIAVMSAHLFNGTTAQRITVIPDRSNPWRWRGVAEGPGFADIVPVDLGKQFDPGAGRIYYAAEPGPAIEAARNTEPFRVFARFNHVPFWKVTAVEDGTRVELIDLRFGTPEQPGFEAIAMVDGSGAVRTTQFRLGLPRATKD
jgi:inner membrane protein